MLTSIDHIVFTASDMDKSNYFYCDVLGITLKDFTPSDGGEERKSLKCSDPKINLHHANNSVSGAVDI